jgi:Holliday junction resolvase RusA-like endonuclease
VTYSVVVPGQPRGKARPRFTRTGHAYTDAKTRNYEAFIKSLFVQKYGADFVPLEGPLEMEILVFLPIPASASKKRRIEMEWGRECPIKRPDCSNICKAHEDALTGIGFKDDAQIVSLSVEKRYSKNPHTELKFRKVGEES